MTTNSPYFDAYPKEGDFAMVRLITKKSEINEGTGNSYDTAEKTVRYFRVPKTEWLEAFDGTENPFELNVAATELDELVERFDVQNTDALDADGNRLPAETSTTLTSHSKNSQFNNLHNLPTATTHETFKKDGLRHSPQDADKKYLPMSIQTEEGGVEKSFTYGLNDIVGDVEQPDGSSQPAFEYRYRGMKYAHMRVQKGKLQNLKNSAGETVELANVVCNKETLEPIQLVSYEQGLETDTIINGSFVPARQSKERGIWTIQLKDLGASADRQLDKNTVLPGKMTMNSKGQMLSADFVDPQYATLGQHVAWSVAGNPEELSMHAIDDALPGVKIPANLQGQLGIRKVEFRHDNSMTFTSTTGADRGELTRKALLEENTSLVDDVRALGKNLQTTLKTRAHLAANNPSAP